MIIVIRMTEYWRDLATLSVDVWKTLYFLYVYTYILYVRV